MIPMIDSTWPSILVDASLRGSVVLLAAFGVAAVMRRASAAARHLVWTLALGGALIIPLLGSVLPAWPVLTLPAVNAPTIAMSTSGGVSLLASWETMAVPPAQQGIDAAPVVPASPTVHHEPLDWRWIVAVLWATGALVLALRLLVGVLRVRWLARRAVPVDDPAWLQLAHVLARRFGLARPVTLLRSERGSVPMTWGTVYPVVLLPAEADGWSKERRTVVLAHELAHIRRWDAATQWIAHLALALYWFNPLVWIAARRLQDERERACDDAVLAAGTRPTEYADHLLDIVRSLGVAEGSVAALAMARRSQFEGRLLAILDRAARRGGVSGRLLAGTVLVAAGVVLPLAAMRAAEPALPALPSPAAQAEAPDAPTPAVPEVPVASAPAAPKRPASAPVATRQPELAPAPVVSVSPRSVAVTNPPAEVVQTRTDNSVLVQLLQSVATRSSSGEKTAVLVQAAENHSLADAAARKAFFNAARTISSSGDRRRVLATVLNQQRVDAPLQTEVLRSTLDMSSGTDQRAILVQVINSQPRLDDSNRKLLLSALDKISSSTDRERVLMALLDRSGGTPEVLADVFRATAPLPVSSSKANILHRAATRYPAGTSAARDAFFASLSTISSDSEYRRVASAVVGAPERPGTLPQKRKGDVWGADIVLHGSHHGVPSYTLTLRGRDVVFNAARTDVAAIPSNGFLHIEHTRLPGSPDPDPLVPEGSRTTLTRYLRISRNPAGGLQHSYRVNGQERPWDAAGQSWLAGVLRKAMK